METKNHSVQFAGGNSRRATSHLAFFNSIDEEHRVLRSFIKDGLERGKKLSISLTPPSYGKKS